MKPASLMGAVMLLLSPGPGCSRALAQIIAAPQAASPLPPAAFVQAVPSPRIQGMAVLPMAARRIQAPSLGRRIRPIVASLRMPRARSDSGARAGAEAGFRAAAYGTPLPSGALAAELSVQGGKVPVFIDRATRRLLRRFPAGAELTIFGSQARDMLSPSGHVARTGRLIPTSDIDLYATGTPVPDLDHRLEKAYPNGFDSLPHVFNLLDMRPESWIAASQFRAMTRAFSQTRLAVTLVSSGDGRFQARWALPQGQVDRAYDDWRRGIVRYLPWRAMSFAQAMLGLRLVSRGGGAFDPGTEARVAKALRPHAGEGALSDFISAFTYRWMEERPEFMEKVFRGAIDPGGVFDFLLRHDLYKGAMKRLTLEGLKMAGRVSDALISPALPEKVRSDLLAANPPPGPEAVLEPRLSLLESRPSGGGRSLAGSRPARAGFPALRGSRPLSSYRPPEDLAGKFRFAQAAALLSFTMAEALAFAGLGLQGAVLAAEIFAGCAAAVAAFLAPGALRDKRIGAADDAPLSPEFKELISRGLELLYERLGIPMPRADIIGDWDFNAGVRALDTLRSPFQLKISGEFSSLAPEHLLAALAHELGHMRNRDKNLLILLVENLPPLALAAGLFVLSSLVSLGLGVWFGAFAVESPWMVLASPVFFAAWVLASLAALRLEELRADDFAAWLVGASSLASLLKLMEPQFPSEAGLLSTHPAPRERIRRLTIAGHPFRKGVLGVQIGVDPATLTPVKDLDSLDEARLRDAVRHAGDQAIQVDSNGRVLDGHHRLKDALRNRRPIDAAVVLWARPEDP